MEFWGKATAHRPSGAPTSVFQAPHPYIPKLGRLPIFPQCSGDPSEREMSHRAHGLAFPLPDVSPLSWGGATSKSRKLLTPVQTPSLPSTCCEVSTQALCCGTQEHPLKMSVIAASGFQFCLPHDLNL